MSLFKQKLEKKYLYYFRKCNSSNGLIKLFYRFKLHRLSLKTQIQIPYTTKIGKNFNINHLGQVIINPRTVIGDNVSVSTGVLIGQENRGKREGCPKFLGDCWIGANSVIVGNVTIGKDVLIAPNAYVNIDVPDHSVVIGNPAVIHHKDNATEGYL